MSTPDANFTDILDRAATRATVADGSSLIADPVIAAHLATVCGSKTDLSAIRLLLSCALAKS